MKNKAFFIFGVMFLIASFFCLILSELLYFLYGMNTFLLSIIATLLTFLIGFKTLEMPKILKENFPK